VQYSNREKKHHKSDSSYSKQFQFNANDVNKVYKLIYEKKDSTEKKPLFIEKRPLFIIVNDIKSLFREDKETINYLRTIKTIPMDDIEHTLAVSIFLSVCRINFIGGQDTMGALKECTIRLERVVTHLEIARTNKTEVGIDKKIVRLTSAINNLKIIINIRYKIHKSEGDGISLIELKMAANRRTHKSFYRLIQDKELDQTENKSEVSMISARKWYMKKYDIYKDIPSGPVTESLLYALMRG
jgi:hypothetical protein